MRRAILTLFFVAAAGSASAEERYINIGNDRVKLLACFNEVMVPAKYSVKKVLMEPARQAYVKRSTGRVELVEYPAVYREERTLLEASYKLMKPIPCN
ncbi:hypothetical protein BD830_10516 [Maritimibacter alkaliphilus HTCC2654]|uniref:Uncharacterized protein n=1 Tax=Maritimibacter alkaliphilus HTCC2654 TaxID=314271 RepID=A3VJG1_9RHOB|nr:hypothetical protein [Maritimibacter alkaliphilus]EAQ11538.1 hypothetical protein RB2654_03884 [Rhodobacterales bacterium HTCC2654] [Maritimibacter alkaliphilus HTCC2654]TYP81355.1 hypothetical protein BD830_10516 [Maritimibacter alkaliphilus HTCC2654]